MKVVCQLCGVSFFGRKESKFCSKECYTENRFPNGKPVMKNCLNCGKEFKAWKSEIKKGGGKYCGRSCFGTHSQKDGGKNLKTGKTFHKGYVQIWKPDHPYQMSGRVLEHRVVIEQKIGRYLRPDEQVHHINHIKNDNRIENLMVVSHKEHRKMHLKRYLFLGENLTKNEILEIIGVPIYKYKYIRTKLKLNHYEAIEYLSERKSIS
jgi:hypothetical protein